MMNINFNRIITTDLTSIITEDRLKEIKAEAILERNYIKRFGLTPEVKEFFSNKAEEIAFINKKNEDKTKAEKALLAANIVFDDEKLAEILNKGNFTVGRLRSYLKLLTYLKSKENNYSKADKLYLDSVKLFTSLLSRHVAIYVGRINPNVLINKINEILSFNSELLITETNKKAR